MKEKLILHRPKSEFAYAYSKTKLHITLRTGKDDYNQVMLIHGDPFMWSYDSTSKWVHKEELMTLTYQTSAFDYYFIEIDVPTYRVKYSFLLSDKDNDEYLYGTQRMVKLTNDNQFEKTNLTNNFYNFPFLNEEDVLKTPIWVKDTIWYQIFPDRFASVNNQSKLPWGKLPVFNNEHYGGNLQGVISKLEYLHNLGITGIYFTPIFLAPSAHKYDTIDYFKIDPQFGTNEDFKELVKKAHEYNIKVMLDGVFNHSGYFHPFFQDVVKNNEKSIYKNAFHIRKFPVVNYKTDDVGRPLVYDKRDLNFETFAFTPYMPKWNTNDPLVQKHLLDVISYWIKEYDIDGWRLDVSNEISHDFLRQIRRTALNAKSDVFILGENWDQSLPWLLGDQLDSVMNYNLTIPIWELLEEKITYTTFKDILNTYLALTPKNAMANMFNLVGSHDTIRIKRRFKDNPLLVMQAYLWMFLSSGAPNIYYGDEIGMTGEHDPDNRRTMIWDEKLFDHDFYTFTKKLINLRKTYPEMADYHYYFEDYDDTFIFKKRLNRSELLCIMNNKDDKTIFIHNHLQGGYINLLTDEKIDLKANLKLGAYQSLLLKKI